MLIGDLEPSDYKTIKTECEDNIVRMEAKLQDFGKKKSSKAELLPILDDAISTLCDLYTVFTKSAIEDQRRLIGSMLPEKFDFETLQHRTALASETFQHIFLINNELKVNKKGQKIIKNLLPRYGSRAFRK